MNFVIGEKWGKNKLKSEVEFSRIIINYYFKVLKEI